MMRVSIRAILAHPVHRKAMMVGVIVATQARAGIETSPLQAAAAYDRVQRFQRKPAQP